MKTETQLPPAAALPGTLKWRGNNSGKVFPEKNLIPSRAESAPSDWILREKLELEFYPMDISQKAFLQQERRCISGELQIRDWLRDRKRCQQRKMDWGRGTLCSTHSSRASRASLSFSKSCMTEGDLRSSNVSELGLFYSKWYRKEIGKNYLIQMAAVMIISCYTSQ